MKYLSVFSGIGGFEAAIHQVIPDAECVGFSEINQSAIAIYNNNFKGHKNYGDATRINAKELPNFDLLVGGFPCQAFSIAGKRAGFGDTRGTLFFEIARIIEEKQPRFLVLENVKGLLSHDKGRSAAIIMSTIDEMGYDAQWHICNSINHGVAQNRERIIIVGHRRAAGECSGQIFPVAESNKFHSKSTNKKIIQMNKTNLKSNGGTQPYCQDRVHSIKGISPAINTCVKHKIAIPRKKLLDGGAAQRVYSADGSATTQTALGGGQGAKTGLYAFEKVKPKQMIGGSQGNRVYNSDGVAITQAAQSGGKGAKTGLYAFEVMAFLSPKRTVKRQNGRRYKQQGEPSFTLTAQDRHGIAIAPAQQELGIWKVDGKEYNIRTLTPIESERLQGFKDNSTMQGKSADLHDSLTRIMSDNQRLTCIGNAVTVDVIAYVIQRMVELGWLH